MKKLSLSLFALALASFTAQAAVVTLTTSTNGNYLLSTNGMDVYRIVVSSAYNTTIDLFDQNTLAAPYHGTNGVTAAYVKRESYATNYVTSYVGFTGFTNWYTNAGRWTYNVTNAASTNALPILQSFAVAANTVGEFDTDISFARGVNVRATTNATIILYYNPR